MGFQLLKPLILSTRFRTVLGLYNLLRIRLCNVSSTWVQKRFISYLFGHCFFAIRLWFLSLHSSHLPTPRRSSMYTSKIQLILLLLMGLFLRSALGQVRDLEIHDRRQLPPSRSSTPHADVESDTDTETDSDDSDATPTPEPRLQRKMRGNLNCKEHTKVCAWLYNCRCPVYDDDDDGTFFPSCDPPHPDQEPDSYVCNYCWCEDPDGE